MGIQYQKVKSASKQMLSRGPGLQALIQQTLRTCSDLVGSTLGPGGLTVVIEHQETGVPPVITKDGVTVFRNLGFADPAAQVLMESARDAAVRTATEAGDGTTTATILAEAFSRRTQEFCAGNPQISPQRVARVLRELVDTEVLPRLQDLKLQPRLGDPAGRAALHAVARTSANGDTELATAVLQCFDAIGDAGNVTIAEAAGPAKYVVQKIEGYPVPGGYEDSCGPWYQKFVNDPGTQSMQLERPAFILHHGRISDYNTLWPVLTQIAGLIGTPQGEVGGQRLTHNVVVAATGFSETVLANLAVMFASEGTLNVYPLLVPMSPIRTGQHDFLADLAALTGARIFDPLEHPLQNFEPGDLGVGPTAFEATRFRSNVIGRRDDILVLERVDQIEKQLGEAAVSELERTLLRERVAKLTSGITRLVVQGSSYGDVKERRDRAEDAVCAVRGAIRDGALPGGGAVLAELSDAMMRHGGGAVTGSCDDYGLVAERVVAPALLEPVHRLFTNAGYTPDAARDMTLELETDRIYDIGARAWVNPVKAGVLDSLPAVREAIRNSASIAAQLGTCGGVVAFPRDLDLERSEARDTAEFLRNANVNEANERG